jgi:Cu/Zn superoxide dismutase
MSLSSDIPLKTINGKADTLRAFDGKALLIVNVASKCGFTPQYAGLEALHKRFRDRGFAVLGFPCDQFGHQEPGDEAEIAKFRAGHRGDSRHQRPDRRTGHKGQLGSYKVAESGAQDVEIARAPIDFARCSGADRLDA